MKAFEITREESQTTSMMEGLQIVMERLQKVLASTSKHVDEFDIMLKGFKWCWNDSKSCRRASSGAGSAQLALQGFEKC